jgi:hypothetical protein
MFTACESHFAAECFGEFPELPTQYQNTPAPDVPLYARFYVLPSESTHPIGMGKTAKTRSTGVVYIEVTGPKDQGAGATQDIAWQARKWFSDLELETPDGVVVFGTGSMKDRGVMGESFVTQTTIPFRCDYNG